MEVEPCATLYINRINEKVKPGVSKKMLNMLFSQYGKVLDINIGLGISRKGQVKRILRELLKTI